MAFHWRTWRVPQRVELWSKATTWLHAAESVLAEPEANERLARIMPSPLNSSQLHTLQETAERLIQERKSRQLETRPGGEVEQLFHRLMTAPILSKRGRVRATWHQVHRSSLLIAGLLIATLLVSVLEATVWRQFPLQLIIGGDIALITVALGLWLFHYFNLRNHYWALAGLRVFREHAG